MKNRRTIILLVAILAVNLILAGIFRDFIRENVLIPILYLIWYIGLFVKSLGQICLWPFLMIILAIISLRILRTKEKERLRSRGYAGESLPMEDGRVMFWMKYIRRKSIGIENLSFVSFRLRELVLSVLAYQENLTSSEIELELARGRLDVPAEVRGLLKPRDEAVNNIDESPSIFLRIMNWLKKPSMTSAPKSSSEMTELVNYLEEQLEIEHDDGNH